MPSVKIPKKSTNVDMTPFVDVAFLILTFFIMATKFKPPSPVEVTTPSSVSADKYPDNDAVMIRPVMMRFAFMVEFPFGRDGQHEEGG